MYKYMFFYLFNPIIKRFLQEKGRRKEEKTNEQFSTSLFCRLYPILKYPLTNDNSSDRLNLS